MKTHLILTFAVLLICAGAAFAQTPDGLPPALETVCDNEIGAAYGFCNAYCEAMDCDSAAPSASETACSKVRTKFQNIAGRDLPCELSCPCTSIPEFNAVLASFNYCYESGYTGSVLLSIELDLLESEYVAAAAAACGYINVDRYVILPVTAEESAVCLDLLHGAAASRNLTCESID